MFKNMRVGLRLGLSFAVVISFFILIGATAWWSIAQLQNDLVVPRCFKWVA
jgi:methyl-accepting chemotaxis protein